MSEYSIGKLMKGIREGKGLSQAKLYDGLCGRQQIYKFEYGMQEPPKLVVDALFQRMGLSADMYAYVFSLREYEDVQRRAKLTEALRAGNFIQGEMLLKEYEELLSENDKCQKQFIAGVRLLLGLGKSEQNVLELTEETRRAIALTMPDFSMEQMGTLLFSRQERMLAALLAELLCRTEGHKEEGIQLYWKLLFHAEEQTVDLWERERQIPVLVLLIARKLSEQGEYSQLWICEKGISALRAVGSLSLMEELVHYEQEGWTKGNLAVPEDESAAEWARGIESLRQLKTEYGLEEETFGSDFAVSLLASLLQEENRGLILGEVLRCMRKERGMSVEELADGICDVAHLRKLELGRMQPHMDTYTMLMERLGKEGCRYYPIIQTEDYRMYECRQKVAQYLGGYEYEKAEYELRKLENGLDLRESTNRRLILELRAAFDSMRKRITSAEKLELLYKALGEKAADRENLSKRSLLREEVLIWNNIAITLEELGRREEGIAIYQDILASYESSALGIESNKKEYLLILRNLVGFLGRDGDHEEAIKISELGIRLSLECKIGNYLVVFLHIKAWNFERMLEKEEKGKENIKEACLSLYRQAFHVAFMIKHRYYKQRIQEHCVKYYGINIRKIKEYR